MERNLKELTNRILDILKGYGLGKYSIRNYYYEGFKPIIDTCSKNGITDYIDLQIKVKAVLEDFTKLSQTSPSNEKVHDKKTA